MASNQISSNFEDNVSGTTILSTTQFNDLPDGVLTLIFSYVFNSYKHFHHQLEKEVLLSNACDSNGGEKKHNGNSSTTDSLPKYHDASSPEDLYHRSIYELETLPFVSQSPLHHYLHKSTKFLRATNGANGECDDEDDSDDDFGEDSGFGLLSSGDVNFEHRMISSFCELLQNWLNFASVNRRLRKFMKRNEGIGDLLEFDLINFAYFYMFNNEKLVSPTYSCIVEGQDIIVRNEYRTVVHQLFMDFVMAFIDREFVKRICLDCSFLFDWKPIDTMEEFTSEKKANSSLSPNYLDEYSRVFPNIHVLTLNFTYRGKSDRYQEPETIEDISSKLLTMDTGYFQTLKDWKHLNEIRLCWHVDVDEDTQMLDLVLGSHLMQEFLNIVSEAKKINQLKYISVYINGSAFHVTKTERGEIVCNDSYPTNVMEELNDTIDDHSMLKLLYVCIDHYGYAHYKKQPLQLSLLENILHIEINDINCVTVNQLFNLSYPKLLTLILTDVNAPSREQRDVAITAKFPNLEEFLIKSKLNSSNKHTKLNIDLSHMKAEKVKKVSMYGLNDFLISKTSFGSLLETLEVMVLRDDTFNFSHWFTSLGSLKNLRFKVEPVKKKFREDDYLEEESTILNTSHMKPCTVIIHDKLTNLHIKDRNTRGISIVCPRLKELVVKAPHMESCEILCPAVQTIDLNDILMGFEHAHQHLGGTKYIKYSSHQWKWHTPLLTHLNLLHSLRPNYSTNESGGTSALILPNALIAHVKELQVKLSITTFDNERELFPPLFARIDNLCGHKNRNGSLEKVKIKLDVATYYLSNPMVKHFRAKLEWNDSLNNVYDSDEMKDTIQKLLACAKRVDSFKDHTMEISSPYLMALDVHIDEKVQRCKITCPNMKRFDLIDCSLPSRVKFCDETASSLEHICLVGVCSPFNHLHTHSFRNLKVMELVDPQQRFSFQLEQLPSLEVLDIKREYGHHCHERSYVQLENYRHTNIRMIRVHNIENINISLQLDTPKLRVVNITSVTCRKCDVEIIHCPKLLKKDIQYSIIPPSPSVCKE